MWRACSGWRESFGGCKDSPCPQESMASSYERYSCRVVYGWMDRGGRQKASIEHSDPLDEFCSNQHGRTDHEPAIRS